MVASRRSFQSSRSSSEEAIEDAKAQATRSGLRTLTVARVSGKRGEWTVELAVRA